MWWLYCLINCFMTLSQRKQKPSPPLVGKIHQLSSLPFPTKKTQRRQLPGFKSLIVTNNIAVLQTEKLCVLKDSGYVKYMSMLDKNARNLYNIATFVVVLLCAYYIFA